MKDKHIESIDKSVPLFVDLDGTLLKSDLLFESLFALIKLNFFNVFMLPMWLLEGKAGFKAQIAGRVTINPRLLPYNLPFLKYLRKEHESGRKLILATASNEILVHKIAEYLDIFSDVLASTSEKNLSGKVKLKEIQDYCHGEPFDYAGNDKVDLKIFPFTRKSILVNSTTALVKKTQKVSNLEQIFEDQKKGIMPYLKAIRVHQWMKNILIFVALVASHNLFNVHAVINVLIGFFSFSFCASSMYIFNDLLDLPSDRDHKRKKFRPFAAGDVSIQDGIFLMFILLGLAFGLAATISISYLGVLLMYMLITLSYSLCLKTYVLIDVLILAGLYTLRVIAGAVAISVVMSFWLLAFSMFMFLNLALVKRCSELITLSETKVESAKGRDYQVTDLDMLKSMGIASGYLSTLVVAFYVNSPDVLVHYPHPKILWLLCPILLYWVSRVWLKTGRGEMHHDPLVFSIKDRGSRFVAVMVIVVVFFASMG